MSHGHDFDRIADAYMADGPTQLTDRVLDAALAEIHLTRQRHSLIPLPPRRPIVRASFSLAAGLVVTVVLGAMWLLLPGPSGGQIAGAPAATLSLSPTSTAMPLPTPYGPMEPGSYRVDLGDDWPAVTFTVGQGWTGSNDCCSPPGISKRGVGSISFGITTEVDMGVHDDPAIACGAPYTPGPMAEATVGNVVAAWRSNHDDPTPPPVDLVIIGSLPAMAFSDEYDIVKDNALGCGGAPPWERDRSVGVLDFKTYLIGLDGGVLEIWVTNWADASPVVRDELDATRDSIHIELDHMAIGDLPAGELAGGGRYFMFPDSGGFGFEVPADGWFASMEHRGWVLTRHVPPTVDGEPVAEWRVSLLGPDVVYADPCAQAEGPPVGEPADFEAPVGRAAAELVAALGTFEGTRVLSSSSEPYWPQTRLEVAVPEAIQCDADQFAVWGFEGHGPRHPSAVPTRFRLWVLDLSSDRHIARIHGSDRAFVEAELLTGAGAGVEQELQEMVDSIGFPG